MISFLESSSFVAGIRGHCPHCRKTSMFKGFLSLKPSCEMCELSYNFADSGDGPAVFIMFIVGFFVVGLALWIELAYQPPLWLHLSLWLPLAVVMSIILLRPLKGLMIVQQYIMRAEEGRFQ